MIQFDEISAIEYFNDINSFGKLCVITFKVMEIHNRDAFLYEVNTKVGVRNKGYQLVPSLFNKDSNTPLS